MAQYSYIADPATPADEAERVIDDGYFTGQADAGRGGPLSTFVLSQLQRFAHHAYIRLFDKTPGVATPRVYRTSAPRGHNHDGSTAGGPWIGNNLAGVATRMLLDTRVWGGLAPQSRVELYAAGPLTTTHVNLDALVRATAKTATWLEILTGPGTNRLRVSVLWTLHDAASLALVTTPAVTVAWRVGCSALPHTVTRNVPQGVAGWAWTDITTATLLHVSPGAANDINLEVAVANGGDADDYRVRVWGYVIAEERE